ncbi:MAG: ATP-binding cassette domain-containing protein [Planctomycetota bacterium]|nr:MAG: ATP-binding cassette domain-containing protein [Planctomycetota bacterium]
MALITVNQLQMRFRGPLLLDDVSCRIEEGQRIGLIGRNGAGKTTLMRILCGEVEPDAGEVTWGPGVKVAWLPQEVPQHFHGRAVDVVMAGGKDEEAWQIENRARHWLTSMELPAETAVETLSSGMKRRVLLARALVSDPEVLLLDEPTNHLDIDTIAWLETFLGRFRGTLMFVTHDRRFLQTLATRILEIDRGRLFDWSCDYETFLARKAELLAAEEKQNALFDKRLAEEEAWIRQGIKARRTRNEGRVRALLQMRRERAQRRVATGSVRLEIQEGQRSGRLVAEAESIGFRYGKTPVFDDFSTTIMRGDKIGIVGPNGAGKTTLLRVLLGELKPTSGTVRLGTNLQIAYFDQLRGQLDEERSVQENVGEGYETVEIDGRRRHVLGYLQEFLFSPERARTPVRFLSGGERNRVLLAKLFAKPANLIVLDEPTNDLDAETLELLESRLVEFAGTVLLVSHDRTFLNNVVTSTIVYENGNLKEYVGGYDDWIRQRAAQSDAEPDAASSGKPASSRAAEKAPKPEKSQPASETEPAKPLRPTYKERQERESLPERIEQLETDVAALHEAMAQPEFFRQSKDRIAEETARLKSLEDELAAAYARWEELDELAE